MFLPRDAAMLARSWEL